MKVFYSLLMILIPCLSFAQWTTSGANIYNSNSGNVGIGTTSPVTKLQVDINNLNNVYSTATTGMYTRNLNATDNNYNGFQFGDASGWGVAGIMAQVKSHANHTASLSFFTRMNGATPAPQMTINENGNVGIGTITPQNLLHIHGVPGEMVRLSASPTYTAGAGPEIAFWNGPSEKLAAISGVFSQNDQGNYGSLLFKTRTSDAAGVETKMSILHNGYVGIGTTSPDYKLTVQSGGIRSYYLTGGDYPEFRSSLISSSSIQGVRVEATSYYANKSAYGVVGLATSSYNLPGTATAYGVWGEGSSPADSFAGFFNGNLGYTGNFGQGSDKKLKENIQEIPASLDIILKMKPKQYTYKKIAGLHFPIGDRAGFIAQDIQELLPHLVNPNGIMLPERPDSLNFESGSEKYLTLDYIGLIPYIVKSIQEQQLIIEKQNVLIESILLKDSISSIANKAGDIPHIIKLYPNPAQNQLDVECFTNDQIATIVIYNKEGKLYKSLTVDNASTIVSLDSFENGIYMVALFVNGTPFDVKRFIVSK